jgi:hypothetical protein
MEPADEVQLRGAGATDEVIGALWAFDRFAVPEGAPLGQDDVITLLRAGVPVRRIERIVATRKAQFRLTNEGAQKIKDAGGTESLIGLIAINLVEEKPPPAPKPEPTPAPAAPTTKPDPVAAAANYESLIKQTREAVQKGDFLPAIALAQEAKQLDDTRPEAYLIAGEILLNHLRDVTRGGVEYNAVLERGGEVEFRVLHIHGRSRLTMRESSCRGRLTVRRAEVEFRGDTGEHSFHVADKLILEASTGSSKVTLGLLGGGVRLEVSRGAEKPQSLVFRSLRERDSRQEEDLILDLIRKH